MEEKEIVVADTVDRMTVAPLVYDSFAVRFTAGAPSGGVQSVTLDSVDYVLFEDGMNEESDDVGMTISRDGLFTNLYNGGGMDRSARFEIHGIGFQFHTVPFVGTLGLDSGAVVTGSFGPTVSNVGLDPAVHAENLASLFLAQTYVEVGASEEECVALAGPVSFWGMGGIGLGDNAVAPHLLNNLQGNHNMFRFALLNEPVRKDVGNDNVTVRVKRSAKIALTYLAPTFAAGAVDVAYIVHCVAFGRRI